MSPPCSDLIDVRPIVNAGRGVIARVPISPGTVLYTSEAPAAHVIFWQYRKEVCATCFHYDRGRTLPVRLNPVGKVFCSDRCRERWLNGNGGVGIEAWEKLHAFVQSKSRSITNNHSLPSLTPKPGNVEIANTWSQAETTAKAISHKRASNPNQVSTAANQPWCQVVDPDILSYLLSGLLFHHLTPSVYDKFVPVLALDPIPYRSISDLEAHTNSYLQLVALLPSNLITSLSSDICQTVISAASHNSFGLRSGDEYLGYALYPGASYFNHSCRPNLRKERIGNLWQFSAVKEIGMGEECCITYLGGDEEEMTAVERRARLREYWSFECACARCGEESEDVP